MDRKNGGTGSGTTARSQGIGTTARAARQARTQLTTTNLGCLYNHDVYDNAPTIAHALHVVLSHYSRGLSHYSPAMLHFTCLVLPSKLGLYSTTPPFVTGRKKRWVLLKKAEFAIFMARKYWHAASYDYMQDTVAPPPTPTPQPQPQPPSPMPFASVGSPSTSRPLYRLCPPLPPTSCQKNCHIPYRHELQPCSKPRISMSLLSRVWTVSPRSAKGTPPPPPLLPSPLPLLLPLLPLRRSLLYAEHDDLCDRRSQLP